MARYLAKNIVASGKADNCTVQLSYAIGVKEPTSLYVYADGVVRPDLAYELEQAVDLTPLGIINKFNFFNINLSDTTNYGHFGNTHLNKLTLMSVYRIDSDGKVYFGYTAKLSSEIRRAYRKQSAVGVLIQGNKNVIMNVLAEK